MRSPSKPAPTAREVRDCLPATRRLRRPGVALGLFALTAGGYHGLLLASVALPWWPAQLLAAAVNGWLIFVLLCVGHDAAHGTLLRSGALNHLIGRLAFLPSLTPFSIWEDSHNRLHHGFTNLRGYDPAYAPLTREEFDQLPAWRRALERSYKTIPGLALYYIVEIWAKYVLSYRGKGARERILPALDRLLVVSFAVAQAGGLLTWKARAAPPGSGALLSHWPALVVGLVLPWLTFAWIIGLVSYLHHTHPGVRWYARRSEWTFYGGQVRGSVEVVFPWPLGPLMRPFMEHTAHHVDPRVPTARLPECQRRLKEAFGDILVERFSLAYLRGLLATCQLYDYENHRWLTFAGTPTGAGDGRQGCPPTQPPSRALHRAAAAGRSR
jgi:omega-6 fatty acid desaturase (delta-12 desaturase)